MKLLGVVQIRMKKEMDASSSLLQLHPLRSGVAHSASTRLVTISGSDLPAATTAGSAVDPPARWLVDLEGLYDRGTGDRNGGLLAGAVDRLDNLFGKQNTHSSHAILHVTVVVLCESDFAPWVPASSAPSLPQWTAVTSRDDDVTKGGSRVVGYPPHIGHCTAPISTFPSWMVSDAEAAQPVTVAVGARHAQVLIIRSSFLLHSFHMGAWCYPEDFPYNGPAATFATSALSRAVRKALLCEENPTLDEDAVRIEKAECELRASSKFSADTPTAKRIRSEVFQRDDTTMVVDLFDDAATTCLPTQSSMLSPAVWLRTRAQGWYHYPNSDTSASATAWLYHVARAVDAQFVAELRDGVRDPNIVPSRRLSTHLLNQEEPHYLDEEEEGWRGDGSALLCSMTVRDLETLCPSAAVQHALKDIQSTPISRRLTFGRAHLRAFLQPPVLHTAELTTDVPHYCSPPDLADPAPESVELADMAHLLTVCHGYGISDAPVSTHLDGNSGVAPATTDSCHVIDKILTAALEDFIPPRSSPPLSRTDDTAGRQEVPAAVPMELPHAPPVETLSQQELVLLAVQAHREDARRLTAFVRRVMPGGTLPSVADCLKTDSGALLPSAAAPLVAALHEFWSMIALEVMAMQAPTECAAVTGEDEDAVSAGAASTVSEASGTQPTTASVLDNTITPMQALKLYMEATLPNIQQRASFEAKASLSKDVRTTACGGSPDLREAVWTSHALFLLSYGGGDAFDYLSPMEAARRCCLRDDTAESLEADAHCSKAVMGDAGSTLSTEQAVLRAVRSWKATEAYDLQLSAVRVAVLRACVHRWRAATELINHSAL